MAGMTAATWAMRSSAVGFTPSLPLLYVSLKEQFEKYHYCVDLLHSRWCELENIFAEYRWVTHHNSAASSKAQLPQRNYAQLESRPLQTTGSYLSYRLESCNDRLHESKVCFLRCFFPLKIAVITFSITSNYTLCRIIKHMPCLLPQSVIRTSFLVGTACANRKCGCAIAWTTAETGATRRAAVSVCLFSGCKSYLISSFLC